MEGCHIYQVDNHLFTRLHSTPNKPTPLYTNLSRKFSRLTKVFLLTFSIAIFRKSIKNQQVKTIKLSNRAILLAFDGE